MSGKIRVSEKVLKNGLEFSFGRIGILKSERWILCEGVGLENLGVYNWGVKQFKGNVSRETRGC